MPDVPILGSARMAGPLDLSLPVLVIRAHSFFTHVGGPDEFLLRFTPVMQIGPGQLAPTSDHHTELSFTAGNIVGPGGLLAQLASLMTPDQKATASKWFEAAE